MRPRLCSLALPTPAETLREVPKLLEASGELSRAPPEEDGQVAVFAVAEFLSPAFGNPDLDTDLSMFSELERTFIERQIERMRRDDEIAAAHKRDWPWVLTELSIAPLWRRSGAEPHAGVIFLEAPVLTTDRSLAMLRGQRHHGGENFAYQLRRMDGRWTLM